MLIPRGKYISSNNSPVTTVWLQHTGAVIENIRELSKLQNYKKDQNVCKRPQLEERNKNILSVPSPALLSIVSVHERKPRSKNQQNT